LAMASEVPKTD